MHRSILGALTCLSLCVFAEDIKIPVGAQTPELQAVAKPATGMTMATVKSQFGAPQKEQPAKGKPPISSWEYENFVVYFENDHVIHSVVKPKYHPDKEIIIKEEVEMSEDALKPKSP